MSRPGWAPPDIDLDRPSVARVYDYCLGGFHNFAADRAVVDQIARILPEAVAMARANRDFLARAVRYCVRCGIDQFLDIGSGIPTVGNVHEVAQELDPAARVVYVDNDPVAVLHARAILQDNDLATVVHGDLYEPERVLADSRLRELLDLGRPVALLMVAVLHFVPDNRDPGGIVARFRRVLAPGSQLAISHGSEEGMAPERMRQMQQLYSRAVAPLTLRSRPAFAALFDGFDLVGPGVVAIPEWRAEPAGPGPRAAADGGTPGPAAVADGPAFGLAAVGRLR